jgi:hypothetical protein
MNGKYLLSTTILILGFLDSVTPRAAYADRHCAVALDSYYAARQQAINGNSSGKALGCEHDLFQTKILLEEAIGDAKNCGCSQLTQQLESTLLNLNSIIANTPATTDTCESIKNALLEAQIELEEALLQCH